MVYNVGWNWLKGKGKDECQDSLLIIRGEIEILGVMDGHGVNGKLISQFIKTHLGTQIKRELNGKKKNQTEIE